VVILKSPEIVDIKTRLTKYLKKDETGIRKSILKFFLNGTPFTTQDVFDLLKTEGFDVNYRGISATVGLMNTRLGILRVDVKGDRNLYTLKEEYKTALKTIMANY
jgi:arginine repressor